MGKIVMSLIVSVILTGCITENSVPRAMDRVLNVKTSVTELDDGSRRIQLVGVGLMNGAGAIETFAIRADKVWGGVPYSYEFEVTNVPKIKDSNSELSDSMKMYALMNYGVYAGLFVLLNDYAESLDENRWQIDGTTRELEPYLISNSLELNVVVPEDQYFKGKLHEGSGLRLASASADVFRKYFSRVSVGAEPRSNRLDVVINLIRWQDRNPLSGQPDLITAEYVFIDSKIKGNLVDFLIIAKEPLFTMEKTLAWMPENYSPETFIEKSLSQRIEQYFDFDG